MATSKRLTIVTFVLPILVTSLVMMGALIWVVRGILLGVATDQSDWVVARLVEEIRSNPRIWSLQADNSSAAERDRFLQELRNHVPGVAHVSVISQFDRPLIESGVKQNTSWFATYSKNDRRDILLSEIPSSRFHGDERFYPLKSDGGAIVGTLRIGLNRDWRNNQIAGLAQTLLIITGLGVAAAIFGAIAFFRLRYTRPLSSLVYAIERVIEGDWSRRVEMLSVETDAAELAVSLNKLFSAMEEDKRVIARLHHEEEEKEKRYSKAREEGIERFHDQARISQSLAERFDIIFRETSDGILLLDSTGNMIQNNVSARKLLDLHANQQGLPRDLRKAVARILSTREPEISQVEFDLAVGDTVHRLRALMFILPAENTGQRMVLVMVRRRDQEAAAILPVGDLLNNLLHQRLEPSVYKMFRLIEKAWPDIKGLDSLSPEDIGGLESAFRGMRNSCEDLKVLTEALTLSANPEPGPHPTVSKLIRGLAETQEQACARPGTLFQLRIAGTVSDRPVEALGLSFALRLLFSSARDLDANERLSVEAFASGASLILRLTPLPAEGSLIHSGDLWKTDTPDIRRLLAERVVADFGGKLLLDKGIVEIVVPMAPATGVVAAPAEPNMDKRVLQFLRGA